MEMQLTNSQEAFKFISFLEEGLSYIDLWTPTRINSGGCGIFADILSDKLTELGIEHKIIGLFFELENSDAIETEKNLKKFVQNGTNLSEAGVGHVCIQIEELYIDSTGIINNAVLHAIEKIELSSDQLKQLITNKNWNQIFDKSCIPFIRNKISEIFSEYQDFHNGMFPIPKNGEVHLTSHTVRWQRMVSMAAFFH